MRRTLLTLVFAVMACGPSRPPADFAPDPSLVEEITAIRMYPQTDAVCTGANLPMRYTAVLRNGTELPFETRYDEDDPPALHVIMLERRSVEAEPRRDGDWDMASDPLLTAMSGFRLGAVLKVKPTLAATTVIAPSYDCHRRAFRFAGRGGPRGSSGGSGPDVTVRVGQLDTPFHEGVVIASIAVGAAEPFYVFAHGDRIPPADWLLVETRGGSGGRGVSGVDGRDAETCGEAGAPGGPGGPGGNGGDGGRIRIVVPRDNQFLAGLIDVANHGGAGGQGGPGGEGGRGGDQLPSGRDSSGTGRTCTPGAAGADGPEGPAGRTGRVGPPIVTDVLPGGAVFGEVIPAPLADLLDYNRLR